MGKKISEHLTRSQSHTSSGSFHGRREDHDTEADILDGQISCLLRQSTMILILRHGNITSMLVSQLLEVHAQRLNSPRTISKTLRISFLSFLKNTTQSAT
jgi:hypothetical protein